MKKIISVISAFALLFSVFAVFASAETTVERDESRNDEWHELGVSSGYGEFINVEQFVENAGKVVESSKPIRDYTQLMLIAVGQPSLDVQYDDSGSYDGYGYIVSYRFVGYFYNPMNCEFYFDSAYLMDGATASGSVLYNDVTYEFSQDGFLANACLNENEAEAGYTTQLFLQVSYSIDVRIPVADDSVEIDKSQLKLYVENLFLEGYSDADGSFADFFKVEDTIKLTDQTAYIGSTTPTSDLMTFLDLSYVELMKEYPINKTKDPKIIQEPTIVYMYEERNTKRLYLYVHDEHALGMFRPGNVAKGYVDISLGEKDNYKILSNLEYVSASDGFIKFCVNRISDNFDDAFTGDNSLYQIREFMYVDSKENERKSDGYFVANFYYKGDAVDISFYSDYISLTDVKNTFYRLNSSATGSGYYQTLSSVYFTIPDHLFELDDDDYNNDRCISSIKGEYYDNTTNIGVVTTDKTVYENLVKDRDMNDSYLYAGHIKTDIYDTYSSSYYRTRVGKGSKKTSNSTYSEIYNFEQSFSTYEFLYVVDELTDDIRIKLEDDILKSDNPFSKSSADTTTFYLIEDDVKELLSKKDWTFGKRVEESGLFGVIIDAIFNSDEELQDSIDDISVFYTLSGAKLSDKIASFYSAETEDAKKALCDELLIDISDYDEVFRSMITAYENNRVFVLLRFDVYDYYFDFVADSEGSTCVFQDKYYKDFEILEIELENSLDSVVYKTSMNPISFVAGFSKPISLPSYDVPELNLPDLNLPDFNLPDIDWPSPSDFSSVLTSILVIGGVVLGVLVLMPIISALFNSRRNKKNE